MTTTRTAAQPSYEALDIDPDLAREMLGHNTHNRNLRYRTVGAYAADMAAGKWRDNGETIKIAVDGTVIDGQHRLSAIIESETKQRMLVVRNLPMQVQETVDAGIKRTFGDVLKLRGETDTMNLAAACRRAVMWESGERARGGSFVATTAQMLEVLGRHSSLRYSITVSASVRRHLPIQGSVLSLCHWLFSQIDNEDCDAFFERLKDGAGLEPQHPVAVLRRTVIDNMTAKSRITEAVMTAYVIKAWNAYRDGRDISFLRFRPGGANPDVFPEPQ